MYQDFWAKYFDWGHDRVSARGDVMKLICPFHADRSPNNDSLVVNVFSGYWNCMNSECKEHGNARDWVQKREGLDENEAKAFVNLAVYGDANPPIDLMVSKSHDNLMHRKFVRAELLARRGWSDAAIAHNQLGWDGSRVIIPVPNVDAGWATLKKYNYEPKTEAQRKAKNVALSGHGSHLYPYSVAQGNEVFICEGEPDVILVREHGWNACSGTAGAGTFKREWAEMLKDKTVYIAYDNDTEGAAGTRIVGSMLKGLAKYIFVLMPPKERNGKPVKDWTDLLVRTDTDPDQWTEVLQTVKATSAVPYDVWSGNEGQNNTSDNSLPDGLVIREGCYCRRVAKDDGEGFEYRPVSNFVFEGIELLQFESGDLESFVRVLHRDGTVSGQFSISGDDWARSDRLVAKVATRHPGATLDTRRADLGLIQQHVYAQVKDCRTVVLSHGGYVPEYDVWVWKNGIITGKGEFVRAEEGRALGFSTTNQGQLQLRLDPKLEFNLPEFTQTEPMSDENLSSLIRACWNHHQLAWVLYLGLSYSSAFSDLVSKDYYLYPLGSISGGPGSGKSTVVSYAMNLWNFNKGLSEATRNDSTKASFSRRLAFFSNLPVWLDEVQNTPFIDNELLKGVYNRASRPIAAQGGSIQIIPTRAVLFVSGEYTNFDQAVMERTIGLNISKQAQNEQAWTTIDSMYQLLPSLGYRAILQRVNQKQETLDAIKATARRFRDDGVDSRMSTNYAVAIAPLLLTLQTCLSAGECDQIYNAVRAHLRTSIEDTKEVDALSEFFNDFVQMANSHQIDQGEHYWMRPGTLLFSMNAVHSAWEQFCRSRARNSLRRIEVLNRLKKAPYCETVEKHANLDNKCRRVVVIDLSHNALPTVLSDLNEIIRLKVVIPATATKREPGQ